MATALVVADDGSLPSGVELRDWEKANLDRYVDAFVKRGWTFATVSCELKLTEAQALLKAGHASKKGAETAELDELEARVQSAMDQLRQQEEDAAGDGDNNDDDDKTFFVRLSTRSPKDAADKRGPVSVECVKRALVKLLASRGIQPQATSDADESPRFSASQLHSLTPSDLILVLRQGFFQALAVKSAPEALEVFGLSSRIVSDLIRYSKAAQVEDDSQRLDWAVQVVVRRFVPFNLLGELRGFVCNGRLCAITQYYTELYSPQMIQDREKLLDAAMEFFSEVCEVANPIVGDSYIVDFALDVDAVARGEKGRHYVVELNPFGSSTGSGLFSWTTDAELLRNPDHDGKPHFRLTESPVEDVKLNAMMMPWKHIVKAALHELEVEDKVSPDDKKCIIQ